MAKLHLRRLGGGKCQDDVWCPVIDQTHRGTAAIVGTLMTPDERAQLPCGPTEEVVEVPLEVLDQAAMTRLRDLGWTLIPPSEASI